MKKKHYAAEAVILAAAALLALNSCGSPAQQTEASALTAAPEPAASAQIADVSDISEASGVTDVSGDSGEAEPDVNLADGAGQEASLAGIYVRIGKAGIETARTVSEERMLATLDNALEYYKENGIFDGYIINEDGTAKRYFPDAYKNVLFEDGCLYDNYGGVHYELNGNALLIGFDDGWDEWVICYRITDEQAAGLPEPSDSLVENDGIVKIYTASYEQDFALSNALAVLREAGEDINEWYDELNAVVEAAAEQEAAGLEQYRREQESLDINSLLSFSDKQLSLADIYSLNGGTVPVCTDECGNISFIGGTCTDKPVKNEQDAYSVAESVLTLAGGDKDTDLRFRESFVCPGDITYYIFSDCDDHDYLRGSLVVKIMVGGDDEMLALSAALTESGKTFENVGKAVSEEARSTERTDPSELPEIVYEYGGYDRSRYTVYEELTEKTVIKRYKLDVVPDIFSYNNDSLFWDQNVWVVYTNNPGDDKYPCLAHYITVNGTYLYSLPVAEPSDMAALSGYPAVYTFDGMIPGEWTGEVYFADGHSETVTVPVMKNEETGKYYLGDAERKIIATDAYEFFYNGFNLDLISNDTNDGWDNYVLMIYSNIIKVWDYYDDLGLRGPDGKGSPVLINCNLCTEDREPMDKADAGEMINGWMLFNFGDLNYRGMAPDMVAHEYTHFLTDKSFVYYSYMNDGGALNEAFSDIMGNLIEHGITGREDKDWEIGENSGSTMRSAADPHMYAQAEYVWDIFYYPHVGTPNGQNDGGGVHYNSGLLHSIAYKLVTEAGMTDEEAVRYWMNADFVCTDKTAFGDLCVILPWLAEKLGMSGYVPSMERYIAAARLSEKGIPEKLEENTALLSLTLPRTEIFSDGKWVLWVEDLGKNIGYCSDYRSGDEKGERDEGDADRLVYRAGTSGDGTINIVVKTGYCLLYLGHFTGESIAADTFLVYVNGVWRDPYEYDIDMYPVREGYNVLSAEGLDELMIEN